MPELADYKTPIEPTWCPGCGDFSIWVGLKKALVDLELAPHEVVLSFDIGCNSNMADKINGYVIKTLHGRAIPAAVGAKLANPKVPVVALGGDGGTLSEGMGHLMHAARSNYDITFLLFNNGDFGLTTGQPTCTSRKGQVLVTEPWGVVEEQFNPSQIALVSKATFVGRVFAGNVPALTEMIKQGINHHGFSFIEIMQNCPTYNKIVTSELLNEICEDLPENHDSSNWDKAFSAAAIRDDHLSTGILYQNKDLPKYLERLPHFHGQDRVLAEEVEKQDISEYMKEFV